MNKCIVGGSMAMIDASACQNSDGLGISITLENRKTDLIRERVNFSKKCFSEVESKIFWQTIEFQNPLPYDLFLEILEDDVVVILKHIKACYLTLLTPKESSIMVVHLCYLGKKWIFAQRVNSLHNSKMCEFLSLEGDVIRLAADSNMDNNTEMTFSLFSHAWLSNELDIELAYLQYHASDNNYSKIYQSPEKGSYQPVLLSYDVDWSEIGVACADRVGGRENWTRVRVDGYPSKNIELFIDGKFRSITTFAISLFTNRAGSKIVLTDDKHYCSLNSDCSDISSTFDKINYVQ